MRTLDALRIMDESTELTMSAELGKLQMTESSRARESEDILAELVLQVREISSLVQVMPMENRVLRRLFFPSIFQRENDVADPSADTFSWVFDAHQSADTGSAVLTVPRIEPGEADRRRHMSESLLRFLGQDSGTVLITGKAGCGKSTFLKYLAHHTTTQSMLRDWAGESRLVVIKVFFWQSDDPLQCSIVGFWRSVLFQLLSQCPEFIAKIFPQEVTPLEGFTDALEIREPELRKLCSRFIELSSGEDYRFCCFIDGLDEHQGDNLSHANMATLLSSWASQANVKVICSSRPYTVFLDVFRDTGTITEFHTLTYGDILGFAQHKFKTELNTPRRLVAQQNCLALVEEIATRAEGVFLWATLAVRALVNQALDYDDTERALRRRLQECPDNLEALFQQMLDKVDSAVSVQRASNMALYLAVHNPFELPLNVLMYSWLVELDWFNDPSAPEDCPPTNTMVKPYCTMEETIERREKVKLLLHQITRGLLEVTTAPGEEQWNYLRYRVDLFHRSVRDFLKDQWKLTLRPNPFTSTAEEIHVYCRLRCLEAEGLARVLQEHRAVGIHNYYPGSDVANQVSSDLLSLFENTFIWLSECSKQGNAPSNWAVARFENALSEAEKDSQPVLLGSMLIDGQASWRFHSRNALHCCSFAHWAAYWGQGRFVQSTCEGRGPGPDDLNLLLSASVGADFDTAKHLLSGAYSPRDKIQISDHSPNSEHTGTPYKGMRRSPVQPSKYVARDSEFWKARGYQDAATARTSVSIWMVFLRDFANNVRSHCWKRRTAGTWPHHVDQNWLGRLAHIIEAFLKAGSDPSVFFVLCMDGLDQLYRVELYQLLDLFKPDNLSSLGKLLTGQPWWRSILTSNVLTLTKPAVIYQDMSMDTLLNHDWSVLGVRSDSGAALMGSFKVRVF